MPNKRCPLCPGLTYHIFNRANGNDKLFTRPQNYAFFLRRYVEYLSPFLDLFAYNLLPNHFHLLARVKPYVEWPDWDDLLPEETADALLEQQFRSFFTSYAKAFNKQERRRGGLFMRPFRRLPVMSETYFAYLYYYIHVNAEKHALVPDFRNWPWCSYGEHLTDMPTILSRQEVLDWFGGKPRFLAFHQQTHTWRKEYAKVIVDI